MSALKVIRTVGQLKLKFEIIIAYASSANCTKNIIQIYLGSLLCPGALDWIEPLFLFSQLS